MPLCSITGQGMSGNWKTPLKGPLCDDHVIHSYHLPPTLQTAEETGTQQSQSLKDATERFEKELLVDALKTCRGNMRRAARALQTTERIFGYKVKKYNIDARHYR